MKKGSNNERRRKFHAYVMKERESAEKWWRWKRIEATSTSQRMVCTHSFLSRSSFSISKAESLDSRGSFLWLTIFYVLSLPSVLFLTGDPPYSQHSLRGSNRAFIMKWSNQITVRGTRTVAKSEISPHSACHRNCIMGRSFFASSSDIYFSCLISHLFSRKQWGCE